MLTDRYIKDFVRDKRAWKRAAAQPMEEATSTQLSQSSWPLFSKGCADNTHSINFANSLRSSSAAPHSLDRFDDKTWCSSTKPTSTTEDILKQALTRNLHRRGLDDAALYAEAKQTVKRIRAMDERRSHSRGPRPHPLPPWSERVAALNEEERRSRKAITASHSVRWAALMNEAFQERALLIAREEYEGRKALFRAAVLERRSMVEEEQEAFLHITHITHKAFAVFKSLQVQEDTRRRQLQHSEVKERGVLSKVWMLEQLQVMNREIEACARREAQLRRSLVKKAM